MAKQQISPETVLAEGGASVAGITLKPTFVQRAGLWLAAGVGAIIAVVTVFVLVFVYCHYPSMPSSQTLSASAPDAKTIEQYKELTQVAIKSGQDLFQTIVTQALLPVLTAILGYIFGKGERAG
ncbi:MAG TPA: hypothetical protein VLH83_02045 [Chthoniobacterales bacterium]|nr:hypothetical protein [Chthoniobacterales bacterium]